MNRFLKGKKELNNLEDETIQTITISFKGDEVLEEDTSKLEKQNLYKLLSKKKRDELSRLDYSISNLRMTCNKLTTTHNKKYKELEESLKCKYECSICMEHTREYVCVPCGHAFCRDCCSKMTDGHCYNCRKKVDFFQRIY
jgi:hypothetical protein